MLYGAAPVRHLLRTLTDEEDDDVYFFVAVGDSVGDGLEEDRLAGLGRRDDEMNSFAAMIEQQASNPAVAWGITKEHVLESAKAQEVLDWSREHQKSSPANALAWKLVEACALFAAEESQQATEICQQLADQEISPDQYELTLNWLAGQQKRDDIQIRVTCAPHYQRITRQIGSAKRDGHQAKGCMGG
ncbi:hypothetical protein LCGC14_1795670, partial [marine sediment metagenome]